MKTVSLYDSGIATIEAVRQLPWKKFGSLISIVLYAMERHHMTNPMETFKYVAIVYYQGHHKKLHTLSLPSATQTALIITMTSKCTY